MNVTISGIHFKNNPKVELYARKKIERLLKFYPKIEQVTARLISEKSHRGQDNDFYCELTVHVPGKILEIVDTEREMDKAIDKAIERMKRIIVKNKEKTINKTRRGKK